VIGAFCIGRRWIPPPRPSLLAALGFARLELRGTSEAPVLRALKTWLGSWRGVGLIAEAMLLQGYDLSLTATNADGEQPSSTCWPLTVCYHTCYHDGPAEEHPADTAQAMPSPRWCLLNNGGCRWSVMGAPALLTELPGNASTA